MAKNKKKLLKLNEVGMGRTEAKRKKKWKIVQLYLEKCPKKTNEQNNLKSKERDGKLSEKKCPNRETSRAFTKGHFADKKHK